MRVKVCGITTLRDAEAAVVLGADALGFNFCPASPRFVEGADALRIIRRLPPFVVPVGVFVNVPDPADVVRLAAESGVAAVQLHGDESPEYCRRLSGLPLIKALRVGSPTDLDAAASFPVRAVLLDSREGSLWGGTGRIFDWGMIDAARRPRVPLILAGGLNASNVANAIRKVRPYAVDVCSGVESEPGVKDPGKLAAFMTEVRNAVEAGN